MRLDPDTPIFSALVLELVSDRDAARARAAELQSLAADVEALHEPDGNRDCPTCGCPAPCLTHLLVRGEITLEQAFVSVRDHQPLDLVAAEAELRPAVPSLAQLLSVPSPSLDRFFDALLRSP